MSVVGTILKRQKIAFEIKNTDNTAFLRESLATNVFYKNYNYN